MNTTYKRMFNEQTAIKRLKFNTFTEALKMNSPFKLSEDRIFYNIQGKRLLEGISYTFEDKGGIIVFSTDVNAMVDGKGFVNKVKGFFKGKFQTIMNRLLRINKLDTLLKNYEDVMAYSIGNFFKGKYFDRENDTTYSEKSLSIEIIGIPSSLLVPIAENIAREFNQKEVLVKDYDSNKIFLVDQS